MRALAFATLLINVVEIPIRLFSLCKNVFQQSVALYDLYGSSATLLLLLGSRTTWVTEAQVLGRFQDEEALQFRQSVQDECTMVSVAVGIAPKSPNPYSYLSL
jgi:fructose-1,6-bisphosphatase